MTLARTLKRINAVAQQLAVLYPRVTRYDTPQQRAAKQRASSDAQRRMNQIYSWQKLELMLSTNFPTAGSGLVVVLTCDPDRQPKNRAQMSRWLQTWRKKMNEARSAEGLAELVAFWSIEVLTSSSGLWHAHLAINNTGRDYEMIRQCWTHGDDIEITPLQIDGDRNWETLARYMTKEKRECQDESSSVGARSWSCTRNVKKPEIETLTVDDDYQLEAPEGSVVLIDEQKRTEFASYRVLKYRWAASEPDTARRKPKRWKSS